MLASRLKTLAQSSSFQHFILGVIVLAGILVGIETYPSVVERYGDLLHRLDQSQCFESSR